MTRRTKDFWDAVGFLALLAWLILCGGCAGVKEAAKQDLTLARDFTACDAEAKQIARAAPSCQAAVSQLLDLMGQPECKDSSSRPLDGGIAIGGVTYICHEEARDGR